MKTVFDFTELMIPGTEVWTTDTFSAISAAIRGLQEGKRKGKEAGITAALSSIVPSHTLLVKNVTLGGNIVCSEMTWPYDIVTANNGNNVMNLTEHYSVNALGNHVCSVSRCPLIEDSELLQNASTAWQKNEHRLGRKYGIENLLAYLNFCKVDNAKQVCVQYVIAHRIWLRSVGLRFDLPESWVIGKEYPAVVSLEEVVEWNEKNGWDLPYTKQVPDNYSQTEEIEASLAQEMKNI